uniref:Methyltransferase small domain-containing protein n=1 Tax=Rhodosorus marinus TaxID=101924 RepID=A0A7S3E8J6_9RHOD|mmetsp:Transcript_14224/g.57264  ORF Transcript_14224/g.57264 Transcript_14224/m.57264 type:complete len:123 (+) Transcript_14224:457-825(+)
MRLRELESALSGVKTFSQPKVELEQYPTSAHLAARMLHVAQGSFGDLEDRCVADMGCGGGILAIGACLLGASYVVGFDVDADALEIAASNAHEEEVTPCTELGLLHWCSYAVDYWTLRSTSS